MTSGQDFLSGSCPDQTTTMKRGREEAPKFLLLAPDDTAPTKRRKMCHLVPNETITMEDLKERIEAAHTAVMEQLPDWAQPMLTGVVRDDFQLHATDFVTFVKRCIFYGISSTREALGLPEPEEEEEEEEEEPSEEDLHERIALADRVARGMLPAWGGEALEEWDMWKDVDSLASYKGMCEYLEIPWKRDELEALQKKQVEEYRKAHPPSP